MNSIIPIQQRLSGKEGFPLRLFAAAFVISILTSVFSGWQSWQMHGRAEEMSKKHMDIEKDIGRIMLFDEVLTMSARMAAATGDFSYEKRYDEFDPQLTAYINDLRADLPQAEIARFVDETDEANLALVKMERQAFALAHQGRRQEATALLTGYGYLRLKKVYAGGMEKTVNAANGLIEKETRHLRSLSLWLATASAIGVLALLVAWFFAIRSARNWAAERREAEDALRKAQDELVHREKLVLLGQVADTVGHELRNPLGVMNNAVYFLQVVLTDADEITKEYLGIIKSEIADAERIVSDLLDAVRTKPPRTGTVEMAEVIGQALRKCDIPASVIIKMDIPQTLPLVRADPMHLYQVFWNLIANAVEAMPEGGELKIIAGENPVAKNVTVSIQDSGCGIASEQQAKLFQPLFTTKARRVGLGLAVVKNLTQANGGSVKAESAPGKGSTFTVTLPCAGL